MDISSSLSRTLSSASFSSSDDVTPTAISASRRTRKRFTNTQLTMLENLFHQTSHPSREDREAVAKAGQMEIKSVTIWFQNKRQTERKSAGNKDGNGRTLSPAFTSASPGAASHRTPSSLGARPSLDRIATRTEMRNHHAPRTPRRITTDGSAAIWDHMPSSPLVPTSPATSDYVDYGKNARSKRTLEWACAAARVSEKDHSQQKYAQYQHQHNHNHHVHAHPFSNSAFTPRAAPSSVPRGARTVHRERSLSHIHSDATPKGAPMDLDSTDDEFDEAITPPSTWGREDRRWNNQNMKKPHSSPADDDDMMKAALALCGLGGRPVL